MADRKALGLALGIWLFLLGAVLGGSGFAQTEVSSLHVDMDSVAKPREDKPLLLVGGRVLDEAGRPVSGAEISVCPIGTSSITRFENQPVNARRNLPYVRSDSSGQWHCRLAPGDLRQVVFRLFHPDYASVTLGAEPLERRGLAQAFASEQALLDRTAVVFMKPGIPLPGIILNAAGEPVEGAKITGDDFAVWTPADGKFRWRNCRPGTLALLVQANGFAPVKQPVQVVSGMEPIKISLAKSAGLRVRIVDAKNQPIVGAELAVKRWGGQAMADWHWKTDAAGRINWNSAPLTEIEFSLSHSGYEPRALISLKADGEEHVFTLRQKPHVSGKVVAAETGQPVATFRIIPGVLHGNHYDWDWSQAQSGGAGAYDMLLGKTNLPSALRVEADGFYPAISAACTNATEDCQVDFALQPGPQISGEVQFSNGEPASGTQVALCTETETVLLGAAKLLADRPAQIRVTEALGQFAFPPDQSARTIVAVHERGYGECSVATFQRSNVLELKSWGQVRGTVRVGNRMGSNELVQLVAVGTFRPLLLANHFTALADAEGRFHIEHVPPGEFLIGRLVDAQFSHGEPIQVRAGENTGVELGKSGRRVVVQVDAAGGRELDWSNTRQPASLKRKLAPLVNPLTNDAVAEQRWLKNYGDSPAGRARQIASAAYVLQWQSNTVFQADSVPAGEYECEIHYHEFTGTETDRCRGVVKQEVRIPASEPPMLNELFDLGRLTLPLKSPND